VTHSAPCVRGRAWPCALPLPYIRCKGNCTQTVAEPCPHGSGTKFEIIPAHIPKLLFEKVLSKHHVPYFTSAEVCTLVECPLLFKDKRALLAYVVYLHLQSHPSFVHQVAACRSEEFFAVFVCGTEHAANGFALLIGSSVVVGLQGGRAAGW
ncbi:hypothetical protein VCUG_02179, partial [Vavraia culicis subsp. floridensis]